MYEGELVYKAEKHLGEDIRKLKDISIHEGSVADDILNIASIIRAIPEVDPETLKIDFSDGL